MDETWRRARELEQILKTERRRGQDLGRRSRRQLLGMRVVTWVSFGIAVVALLNVLAENGVSGFGWMPEVRVSAVILATGATVLLSLVLRERHRETLKELERSNRIICDAIGRLDRLQRPD